MKKTHREAAPFIYKTLRKVKKDVATKKATELIQWVAQEFKKQSLLELEYFEIANEETLQTIQEKNPKQKYRAFIAVFAGNIRLIDNISL